MEKLGAGVGGGGTALQFITADFLKDQRVNILDLWTMEFLSQPLQSSLYMKPASYETQGSGYGHLPIKSFIYKNRLHATPDSREGSPA